MSPTAILYVEFYMSVLSFLVITWRYIVPALRERPLASALTPILLLHSFRHIGMMYVMPAAVPDSPAGFAAPTAYGDLLTAVLAFAALGALRVSPGAGRVLVWIFNVVGFVDLALATVNARRVDLLAHQIGVAYLLPAIVVPALIVSHGLVFWVLTRRALAAAPVPVTGARTLS